MTFSGTNFALGSALEVLLSPITELIIASCCIKPTFHCMSQSDQEMVHCFCLEREMMTIQNDDFFDLRSAHEAPTCHFFTFPICFKCQMTVEWLVLSSLAISRVVEEDQASVMALGCRCQVPMASLNFKALLSFPDLLEP